VNLLDNNTLFWIEPDRTTYLSSIDRL